MSISAGRWRTRSTAKRSARRSITGWSSSPAIPAPASSWWYDKQADKSVAYDPDKARYYLKQSKYADEPTFELLTSSVPYLLDAKDLRRLPASRVGEDRRHVNLQTADSAVVQAAFSQGNYAAMYRNIMSPGEPTYFITQAFTPNQYMSKVSNYTNPKIDAMLKVVFAENDLQNAKPVFTDLMRLLADESPFVWIGYFNATNLWRDRVKNFKPSRGLTINVHDVALS